MMSLELLAFKTVDITMGCLDMKAAFTNNLSFIVTYT